MSSGQISGAPVDSEGVEGGKDGTGGRVETTQGERFARTFSHPCFFRSFRSALTTPSMSPEHVPPPYHSHKAWGREDMKQIITIVALLGLLLVSGCASHRTGGHGLPSVRLTGHDKGGDAVTVTEEGNRTVVDVHSTSGIGRAELTMPNGGWRRPLTMRFHLQGLEALDVNNGRLVIHTSVLSRPPYKQLCELFPVGGRNGSPLEEVSPFWMPLNVANRKEPGQRVIPLDDGYFEVTLPDALLDGNPETLYIQWIDFLRG